MGLTIEQQKALALAKARMRVTAQTPADPAAAIQERGMPGFGNIAFADQAVEAIPIAGPWLKDRISDLRGGISAGLNTVGINAPTKEEMDTSIAASVKGSPVEATAGQVFGTVAPLAVAGMPAAGARLLGMSGGVGSRVALGGVSGGLITGADALARGDSMEEAGQKAMVGGALGGGLPLVEKAIGAGVRALTGKTFDPAEKALARAVRDDRIPVDEVQSRLDALGPDAVLADLGPNLQRQAGAIASLPGEGQTLVREALAGRAAGTNSRIIADTNETLGPAPIPSREAAAIREAQTALSPLYERAFDGARAVDTSDLALDLDSLAVRLRGPAQQAVQKVRGMLNVHGVPDALDPDPYTLLQTRHAIDGLMATETNPSVIAALTQARRGVDDVLAGAVPNIKAVDAQFAELARQNEALGRGQQLLDSGRTAVRPQELADEFAAATPGVQLRLRQGARAEIERIIGTTANDLNALKTALKGDGSWNRDRLVTLFGRERADRLLHVLEREKTFADTSNVVTRNSETAARQAAQGEVNGGMPHVSRDITIPGMLFMGAQKLANFGARTRQTGTNKLIAEALMSRQVKPETLNAVAQALLEQKRRSMLAPAALPLLTQ